MLDLMKHLTTRLGRHATPQAEMSPGSVQAPTAARRDTAGADDWMRFDRFLLFGAERGTYYIRERTLIREDAAAVAACLASDGPRAVRRVVEISERSRARKNDQALFILAVAAGTGDDATRAAALAALPAIARSDIHLVAWLHYVNAIRGWGRAFADPEQAGRRDAWPDPATPQVLRERIG